VHGLIEDLYDLVLAESSRNPFRTDVLRTGSSATSADRSSS
jgi:hypothetical protein